MATNVVITRVGTRFKNPPVSLAQGDYISSDTFTASGTSQNTGIAPLECAEELAVLIVTEERIWVEIGFDAVASANSGFLMLANDRLELGIKAGQRVAIIAG